MEVEGGDWQQWQDIDAFGSHRHVWLGILINDKPGTTESAFGRQRSTRHAAASERRSSAGSHTPYLVDCRE